MVNQAYVSKLVSLIEQGVITISNIKIVEYANAVISVFKAEVVSGVITTDQYKVYTSQDYVA